MEQLYGAEPARKVDVVIQDGLAADVDARLFRIVLENLLGNAWKFTSKSERPRIEMGWTEQGGMKRYYIRDNGVGFDPSYANKLFSPFQRLHSQAEFAGTGIGLATVQRIIARHGGVISAQASVGEGAEFSWTCPTPGSEAKRA
jgi:light-regulated signal transduction histidine kinase (bacteriophytochrome)